MITILLANLIIFLVCIFGLLFGLFNAWLVSKIKLHPVDKTELKEGLEDRLNEEDPETDEVQRESIDLIIEIGEHISTVNLLKQTKKLGSFGFIFFKQI